MRRHSEETKLKMSLGKRGALNPGHHDYVKTEKPSRACECGCGNLARPGNRYVVGHHQGHVTKVFTEAGREKLRQNGRAIWSDPQGRETRARKMSETRLRKFAEGFVNPTTGLERPDLVARNKESAGAHMKRDLLIQKMSLGQRTLLEKVREKHPDVEPEFAVLTGRTSKSTRWIDVAVPSARLAFEYDGRRKDRAYRETRDAELIAIGWSVVHVHSSELAEFRP